MHIHSTLLCKVLVEREAEMRIGRILSVTMGLMLAGAVFGTITGALTLFVWMAIIGGIDALFEDMVLMLWMGAWFGGTLGAVMGPSAAWLLMRHVPLGLAVGGTMLGTLAGSGIGLLATANPVGAMFCGMAGFGVTAIRLRVRFPRGDGRLPGS
jgi:hypothetical protein